MAYCAGCGQFVGDYSSYKHHLPGKGELVLCYKCKRWADRHPGKTKFPPRQFVPPTEGRRVRTFANVYVVSSLGLFAFGAVLIFSGSRLITGVLLILGGISLFLFGLGMRRFLEK